MKHRPFGILLSDLAEGLTTDRRLAVAGGRTFRRVLSVPTGRPAVTVIVLCYNYGRFVGPCVTSVLDQDHVDVSVIVVDDASTDETTDVLASLAARDSRVQVVRNSVNRGQLPSMNAALDLVTTEYVVKLDADDLLAPGSLARSTALMEAHPDVTFAYGRPLHFTGTPPQRPVPAARSWTILDGRAWFVRRCRSACNVISQPEVLMRTAAVRRVGPVREYLPHTFDMHLWLQLALTGNVGRINGPPQGYYRVHDQSLQHTAHAGVLFDLAGRRDAFDSLFRAEAADLPDADVWRDAASSALAANALDRACRAFDRARTEQEPVDEFVQFALDTCSNVGDLPEWKALQKRRAIGAAAVPRTPRYVADAIARRAGERLGYWRWRLTGEQ